MKIPTKIAAGLKVGSLAGMIGATFVFPAYFGSKRVELLENSPAYMGLKEIEKKLPEYEQKLAACVSREKGASISDRCVELANNYDSLLSQQTNLKNSPEYHATMKTDAVLESHQKNSFNFGFPLLVVTYIVGSVAFRNRKREEEALKPGDQ